MATLAAIAGAAAWIGAAAALGWWIGPARAEGEGGAWGLGPIVASLGVLTMVVGLATWSLARRIARDTGSGMPELELRADELRLPVWPGAQAAICCPWAGVRSVTVRPARELSPRWRRARLLSEADVAHMLVVRVLLERDARPRVEGSAALWLLWWLWAPRRAMRQISGALQLQALLCTAPRRAPAVAAALGPIAARMDLRERLGSPRHVWQIEAGADGQPQLVMAGGSHRERLRELLDRPERAPGTWGVR